MLDIRLIRKDPAGMAGALGRRGEIFDMDALLAIDARRRELTNEVESRVAEMRQGSKQIGPLKKQGDEDGVRAILDTNERLKEEIKTFESALGEAEQKFHQAMLLLPNTPNDSTPDGAGEKDNRLDRTWGEKPDFGFEPKAHDDLGEALGILDMKRAAKIAGARFALYRGAGARMERALINFMLDIHTTEHGYTEWLPPFMVNPQSLTGTGQLPKFEEDLFKVNDGQFYLIPTAEVPVTNIHREEILDGREFPLKYVAHTPCFRSEAGSYGKDTRGLIRQHQFNKVELVKFCLPETSYDELKSLTANAEAILQRLGLPYRVVTLCAGDLGFSAAKTYDLEVWVPSQDTYREISSCSNFEDFQARRAQIRCRPEPKDKPGFVHTINGSGLAVGRTVVAILENYQQKDGAVVIPEALRAYMDGLEVIEPG
ncbi:MAG: serine--tRNA ligase [Nitrospinota bacterium]